AARRTGDPRPPHPRPTPDWRSTVTRRVLIVTHGGRPEAVVALHEAVSELERAGFTVTLHDDDLAESFGDHMARTRAREGVTESEVVMVLGGDGTILDRQSVVEGERAGRAAGR